MNRFVLRLPDELYQRVQEEASRQGVSMNQYLLYNITRAVTSAETLAFFAEKSRGADKKKALELLARVADRPPICEEDRIPEPSAPRKRTSGARAQRQPTSPRSLPPRRAKPAAVAHRVRAPKRP
jgi:predicted DNA-binding protein